jgi:hypothetical protein
MSGNTDGVNNTAVGYNAFSGATGSANTCIGVNSGSSITSGSSNVILGAYTGSAAPISATGSNYVVLSDGDANIVASTKTAQTFALQGGTLSAGTGIAFPATQSASTDANTLDDYEEGTWTPSLGGGATGTFAGTYVKVGKLVTLHGSISVTLIVAGSTRVITGVPFPAASGGSGCITAEYTVSLATAITSIFGYVSNSQISIDSRTGAAVSASSNAIFGNGTAFDFTCTYISTT